MLLGDNFPPPHPFESENVMRRRDRGASAKSNVAMEAMPGMWPELFTASVLIYHIIMEF